MVRSRKTMGTVMLLIAAFIWGTAFVAQSLGTNHVGPFTFVAVRFLVGSLTLAPIIYLKSLLGGGEEDAFITPDLLKGGLLCGGILFSMASLQQTGIAHTTAGKAGFITTLYIVIVPLLGLLRGRRVAPLIWGCIAVAVWGMYLLCINGSFVLSRGDAYILACAFFCALHIVTVDHFAHRVDGLKLSCMQFFTCSLLAAAAAFAWETPTMSGIFACTVPILYTGVLSSGVAYTFQILGQREISPTIASLIFSLESVFAVLAGWLVLQERLSSRELVGCVLIFVAVLLAQMPEMRSRKTSSL